MCSGPFPRRDRKSYAICRREYRAPKNVILCDETLIFGKGDELGSGIAARTILILAPDHRTVLLTLVLKVIEDTAELDVDC